MRNLEPTMYVTETHNDDTVNAFVIVHLGVDGWITTKTKSRRPHLYCKDKL